MVGPLKGMRVVVLAGMGPTPFASMLLADMGADIIRIARPANRARAAGTPADKMTPEQDIVNRGVQTIEIDLKDPEGIETVKDLASRAEIFIEGFRPGTAERLGLGPSDLLRVNPAIVYARLTGYGQEGPLAGTAGHDLNYVAQSGLLPALRRAGEAPHPPINLLGDYAGGGAMAAYGIVCAVIAARSTGEGQVIDAAMLDGVAVLTSKIQGLRSAGLYSDEAGTNFLDGGSPYYDTYECSDGKYVALGAIEANFYAAFINGLGVDAADWPEQEDKTRWSELRDLIANVLKTRTRDEWVENYRGVDACLSAVLDFDEAAQDEHNKSRGLYQEVAGVQHPAPAPRFSLTPARTPSAPPAQPLPTEEAMRRWAGENETVFAVKL
jgi:alpha-methylacyl-CoA racemase